LLSALAVVKRLLLLSSALTFRLLLTFAKRIRFQRRVLARCLDRDNRAAVANVTAARFFYCLIVLLAFNSLSGSHFLFAAFSTGRQFRF
jgi:hypothetical protein